MREWTRSSGLPTEARADLMRAWLAILHERHPDVVWLPSVEPQAAHRPDADSSVQAKSTAPARRRSSCST